MTPEMVLDLWRAAITAAVMIIFSAGVELKTLLKEIREEAKERRAWRRRQEIAIAEVRENSRRAANGNHVEFDDDDEQVERVPRVSMLDRRNPGSSRNPAARAGRQVAQLQGDEGATQARPDAPD